MGIRQRHLDYFLFTLLSVVIASCNPKKEAGDGIGFHSVDTILAPLVIVAGDPEINLIDDFAPPVILKVPTRENTNLSVSLSRSKTLLPPEKKAAGFFIDMQNFNTEQGLTLSSIICGFKDRKGNLWFGSSGNGVSKYDGKSFTNYNSSSGLIHNLIYEITEDEKGNIWFATYGGASKFDGVAFTNFTKKDGLPDNDVHAILADSDGNIWFGTWDGISKYDGETFTNYKEGEGLADSYVCDIFQDQEGNIWFATFKGLSKYLPDHSSTGGEPFKNYTTAQGLVDDYVRVITADKYGNLWIGTNRGVSRFDTKNEGTAGAFLNFTETDGLIKNKIMCIWCDRDGNIWLGTGSGLSRYEPGADGKGTGKFTNITTEQGLSYNSIENITEDNSGNLWISTLGGGVCRYDGKYLTSFKTDQGLPDNLVFSIAEDDSGMIWLGTSEGGVARYDGKSFDIYATEQGMPDFRANAMIKSATGDIWMGTDAGLSKFDGQKFTNYYTEQGLVNDYIVSLTEDSHGNIWLGTYEKGLSMFDGESFTNYSTDHGLVHNTVWSILEDRKGNLWFGTRGGVSRFDGEKFINFTRDQGLADNKVSKLFEDNYGNLLIGTWGGGISILRRHILDELAEQPMLSGQQEMFQTFSTSEGLSNDVVYGILEDVAGNIIVGSSLGFTVLKGGLDPTGKTIAKNGIESFNQKTGYPIKDLANNNSMFLDSRGIIWAGTGDKLVRFDYNSVHRKDEPSPVFIYGIKINNESVSWQTLLAARSDSAGSIRKKEGVPAYITDELAVYGKKLHHAERDSMVNKFRSVRFDSVRPFYSVPENLVLPFAFHNITFDFLAIETSRPEMVDYQYKLEGLDDNWSPVSKEPSASYGNIPEGSYTFIVKARNPEGIWSAPISYSFKVLPPWYRSWPAYVFYGLLLVTGIFLVDRFQRQRVISKERQYALRRELEQAREIEKAYSELKSTQKQLIHAEKMASLGELTAGIAHEIQNPLNFVNNFSEVSAELVDEMKQELAVGSWQLAKEIADDIKHNLEKINHHGKRADGIVKGMLQHSRTSTGQKEPTDLNALADEYLRLAYHGLRAKDKSFNADFRLDAHESLPKVNVVPQDIGRVLLNLINNAFYAVSAKALAKADNIYKPTVTISTKNLGDQIEIRVKDNGNGIPEEIKDKIFQPFFTTKPTGEGTGLGLSMSYDIITKGHGGELKVESAEAEGTVFIIQIPVKH